MVCTNQVPQPTPKSGGEPVQVCSSRQWPGELLVEILQFYVHSCDIIGTRHNT